MSATKFGTNILVDGGGGLRGPLYNTTVMNRLHQLSMSDAGRAALSNVGRRVHSLRIVPPDAPPAMASGEVVVFYLPTGVDLDGKSLLESLVRATPSATSGASSNGPMHDIQVSRQHDMAGQKLFSESLVGLGKRG
ncbi:hypothetical protein J421_4741 (plasmid) [Gemmatirosa kalamazoonensis]|uniref:Uncharacterized protein n=1 Tax=Gemmatirosa kalamazoonensis TaxID=861299 RepID=W0RNG0_9BACT|nr:hypothetical protein [Gemmatirosa kalamazoonensis]AHG92276.1 hypothetical protein J421_4741 [Gemmatirosa kalamazoonensis]